MGDKRERMTDDLDNNIVEERNGFSKEDITQQPRWIKFLLLLMGIAMVITTVYLAGRAVPWEPFKVYDVYLHPVDVCPLERVETYQDIELQDGWFTFDVLRGETFWVDEDGRHQGGTFFEITDDRLQPVPRQSLPSSTVRYAPPEAGEWSTGGLATLSGKRFGFIRVEQVIDVTSNNSVIVKEWDDPDCIDRMFPGLGEELGI
jgi:hypothetical protein